MFDDVRTKEMSGFQDDDYNPYILGFCRNLTWETLFTPRTFFNEYKYYLQVETLTECYSEQQFHEKLDMGLIEY